MVFLEKCFFYGERRMNVPELPEVETIRRELIPFVEGQRICSVEILDGRFALPVKNIEGRSVGACLRRGKYLFFLLSGGVTLLVHLGMTGKLLYSLEEMNHPYVRAMFILENGMLYFTDIRTFGKLALLDRMEMVERWRRLGVDPLSHGFRRDTFYALSSKTKARVKDFLLDQRRVSGLGNIYACEVLFRAGIHPERPACTLTENEAEVLYNVIGVVLQEALKGGGTTIRDYRKSDAREGSFQRELCVYGREGDPCPVCGKHIQRQVFSSRSSFYCSTCQV